jgi:hypothetical protein
MPQGSGRFQAVNQQRSVAQPLFALNSLELLIESQICENASKHDPTPKAAEHVDIIR